MKTGGAGLCVCVESRHCVATEDVDVTGVQVVYILRSGREFVVVSPWARGCLWPQGSHASGHKLVLCSVTVRVLQSSMPQWQGSE